MPTFCRHNRFLERCPVCSKALVSQTPAKVAQPRRSGAGSKRTAQAKRAHQRERLRVIHELRASDDGYRCGLVPGLRSSEDAEHLAVEIGFSSGRLRGLERSPPGVYGDARALAAADIEQASWICFLASYISPLQGEDPFAGIRVALERAGDWHAGRLPDLDEVPLGPRTSHDPERGSGTLAAYRRWAEQASSQAAGFRGEFGWSPERRFERVFERLALPHFDRSVRFELLLTLGALGLYELRADSLHLLGASGRGGDDATTIAAKRVFAIGDTLNLTRRSAALADAVAIPIGVLDLALANWGSGERVTLGFPVETNDPDALQRARGALAL